MHPDAKKLHLFFPQNDLALADGKENYTAPRAGVALQSAGETLPLWYGNDGDAVLCNSLSPDTLRKCEEFDIDIEPWNGVNFDFTPAPWGWSPASRKIFATKGFSAKSLPSDEDLDAIRQLSHRRISIALSDALHRELPFAIAPTASEMNSIEEIDRFLHRHRDAIVKMPWSSSGRGVMAIGIDDFVGARRDSIAGALRRQGSILCEHRHDKALDFAMLFTMDNGRCCYNGLSVFDNIGLSTYSYNILAPQSELFEMVASHSSRSQVEALFKLLPPILEELIGQTYSGPLGVDMIAVRHPDYQLAPALEINLRMTMGHVAARIYEKHIVHGRHGRFIPSPGKDDYKTIDHRLSAGELALTPAFSVVVG